MLCIWNAGQVAEKEVRWAFWGILVAYVPGERRMNFLSSGNGGMASYFSRQQAVEEKRCRANLLVELGAYVMYTHMMSQRRKVIRGKAPERGPRMTLD